MIGESLACFPSCATHSAALAARTLDAVADYPTSANAQVIPLEVHAHRPEPYVVGETSLWWVPLPHERTVTPLGTVVNTSISV